MQARTQAVLMGIPDGPQGTLATLRLMRDIVLATRKTMPVRELALNLIRNVPGHKNWNGQIAALHRYVRDSIQYVRDVRNVETLQSPQKTLQYGQGDCDDKSILLSALLESIGHPTRFVAISVSPLGPYAHVYVETKSGNKWIPLETTEPWPAGKPPPVFYKRMVVHI